MQTDAEYKAVNWKEDLFQSWSDSWSPPDNSEIYDWASKNVNLHNAYSMPGRFSYARSRFILEPLKSLKDLTTREVNIMASPRCFKTGLAELFMLHYIANNSGNMLWLQSSDEMVDKMSALRMVPLLKNCPPVKALIPDMQKFAVTKKKFSFPHMNVIMTGAKIRALQSIGYKAIIFDECWLAEQGFIGEARARLQDFQHTSKFLLLSQGGTEGDEWSTEFNKAPIWEWGWVCPSCKKEQALVWNKTRADGTYSGIIWTKDKNTFKEDKWDYEAAGKSARLECHYCNRAVADNPQNRRYLNDTGVYICTKPEGDPRRKSFRWNSMANIEITFKDLVIEYLMAKDILSREGNKIPLQEFQQKRLAKTWNANAQTSLAKIITAEYDPLEKYGDYKFMTIDCQNNLTEFWWVIRSWCKNGESRLIRWGKAATFEELRKIQADNGVRDQCVLIDSGNFATQVYSKCVQYAHVGVVCGKKVNLSWVALKGWDSYDFPHADNTKKLYSPETRGDPNLGKAAQGKTCPLYRWSNKSIKDILVHLRDGKGVKWLCKEAEPEYERQLNSEVLTQTIDKRSNKARWIWVQRTGIPNHLLDCESMQIVGACMVGILGNITSKAE